MTNILVTGGAGYIGSYLCRTLLDLGYKVTILDNLLFNQKSILHIIANDKLSFIHGDVRDDALLIKQVKNHDIIIPLAALVGMPLCNRMQQDVMPINTRAIEVITKNISNHQLIIYPTTNSGYGVGTVKDGELAECTEETPLNPISSYGISKACAERWVREAGGISFRLATVFGVSPRMRLDLLVNDFVYKACRDKYIVLFESHFKRNFIHISDVVSAFLLPIQDLSLALKMKGQVYNVGLSSANLSKFELCQKIKEHIPDFYIGQSEINKDPDQRNYIVSNKKLESLGWVPKIDIDIGIKELIKAYPLISINSEMSNV